MNQLDNIAGRNLTFFMITLWSVVKMILDLKNAFLCMKVYGESFDIHFAWTQMTIASKSVEYHVGYYFLIPVTVGITYNLVVVFSKWKRSEKVGNAKSRS